jgi:hypothetical protein
MPGKGEGIGLAGYRVQVQRGDRLWMDAHGLAVDKPHFTSALLEGKFCPWAIAFNFVIRIKNFPLDQKRG